LVIGADGRDSGCRKAGFQVESDPARASIAGILLDGLDAPSDTVSLFINPTAGQFSMVIPLGGERFRAYAGYAKQDCNHVLSGERSLPDFLVTSIAAGAPAEWFDGAEPAGPLACFEGADRWVDRPYRNGVALVGDAAASSDPSFGCGTSLALRDVRVLRDHLLANDDWHEAAEAYAAEHDRYYGALHRLTNWARTLFYDQQPEAAALRERAFPRLAEDPTRRPDFVGVGPEFPSDEGARRRFFGED
jgi:2-polyprenyl-6-methoxyphenol hydroxylase-like FAD-dependent oxidoreductase